MYSKTVKQRIEISKEEAQSLIVHASIFHNPCEIVAYEKNNDMLYKSFSIKHIPSGAEEWSDAELLEFVRENIPEDLRFS